MILPLGGNTALNNNQLVVKITNANLAFGQAIGMVWLATDNQYHTKIQPAYLETTQNWASFHQSTWKLDLNKVLNYEITRLELIVYTYHNPNLAMPAAELSSFDLIINDTITHQIIINQRHIKTAIVLEIYQKNGQYKCRARGEYSNLSLSSLNKYVQTELNENFPKNPQNNDNYEQETNNLWTGTAFAIDNHHLLTCHHVVAGANQILLHQQGKPSLQAFVVMSDQGSDTAVLKVDTPLTVSLSLQTGQRPLLGESIIAMGFPLASISSQLQVNTGNIAGLMGMYNDIRFLQFTAPTQPGSSGSPLLLANGQVIGMVTATLVGGQNMNYAVKYQLLSAILSSCDIDNKPTFHDNIHTPELVKRHKDSLWLVECS